MRELLIIDAKILGALRIFVDALVAVLFNRQVNFYFDQTHIQSPEALEFLYS